MRHRDLLISAIPLLSALVACGSTEPTPGKPATIQVSAGSGQTAPVNSQLPNPIGFKVTDDAGLGVPNARVDLQAKGGGRLDSASVRTNSAGVAIVRWTLGTSAGTSQTVVAQLLDEQTGAVLAQATAAAIAAAGPVAGLMYVSGSGQMGSVGAKFSDSLVVRATDLYGNPVPGVTIRFAVAGGGGQVSPSTVVSDAAGRAATALTAGAQSGYLYVTAAVGDNTPSAFFTEYAERARAGTSTGLTGSPFGVAVSSSDVVYVARHSLNSLTRYAGTGTASLGTVAVGENPTDIRFNPAGTQLYVTNQDASTLGIVDPATNTQVATVAVPASPYRVRVSPDGARVYVSGGTGAVSAVDVASRAIVGQAALGAPVNGLALNADGTRLYGSTYTGKIVEMNATTMVVLREFIVGVPLQEVVLAGDGSELYVVAEGQGALHVINLVTGVEAPIVPLSTAAFGMTLSPSGAKLFITGVSTGEVIVVDRVSRTIDRREYVGGAPRRIGFTTDGTAVIGNESGYVTWLR